MRQFGNELKQSKDFPPLGGRRGAITAAGGLILNEDNDVLMIFRRGFWDLPKGKLDENETIEQCAVREVKEETGLKEIELVKFIAITRHEYFDTYSNADVLKETHWFEMKSTKHQTLIPQTEEDIVAIEWVNETKLKDYLQKSYATIQELFKTWKK
jgi:ADP-ribose pyrophosphatase YjhB (NUDIX family)